MLVDGKWFDGSTSYVAAHRHLQALAGNTTWVPTYTPWPFTQRDTIRLLLATFHRHNMLFLGRHFCNVYSRHIKFFWLSSRIRRDNWSPLSACTSYFPEKSRSTTTILDQRFRICIRRGGTWSGCLFLHNYSCKFWYALLFFRNWFISTLRPPYLI